MTYRNTLAAALLAVAATACSSPDSGAAAGPALGEAECRAVYSKARELQGIPDGVFVEELEKGVQDCAANGKLDQAAHDCVMAAGSADDLRACKVDLT